MENAVKDPFAVLGVASTASVDELRSAYRARSLLLHPDLHHGRPDHVRREADRAMTQLTQAYEEAVAQRTGGAGRPPGSQAPRGAGGESAAYRFGRLAGRRSRLARDASVAGEQDGGLAYRLGWLVGRRKSR